MRPILIGGLALLLASSNLHGQVTIQLGDEVQVSESDAADLVEAHVSVSSVNPDHLVGAAMVIRTPDLEVIDCTVVSSFDGGRSWSRHDLGLSSCGDPWTLITEYGTALVSVLSDRGILVYRSTDGGRSWASEPAVIPGPHDHEMMTGGRDGNPIYLVSGLARRAASGAPRSAIYVGISTDDGRTFSDHAEVVVSNLSYEAMTPVVGSGGSLLVPLQDHHRHDGGRVASRRSWLLEFSASGRSDPPRLIDEGCNRVGPVGWPTLAAVRTGSPVDRLVWACEREEANGIALHFSDDLGETWTHGATLGTSSGPGWTKLPALAASPSGVLMATWIGAEVGGTGCRILYGAASLDGVDSFGPETQLSSERSCPGESDVSGRFPAGGDYTGLVAIGPDQFQVLWADGRSGRFRLYSRRVTVVR